MVATFVKTSAPDGFEVSFITHSGVMEQLDVGIVPYIVLLVVPVLGRMSDQTDSVRFMATQCFATLIRLMPLEVRGVVACGVCFLYASLIFAILLKTCQTRNR